MQFKYTFLYKSNNLYKNLYLSMYKNTVCTKSFHKHVKCLWNDSVQCTLYFYQMIMSHFIIVSHIFAIKLFGTFVLLFDLLILLILLDLLDLFILLIFFIFWFRIKINSSSTRTTHYYLLYDIYNILWWGDTHWTYEYIKIKIE